LKRERIRLEKLARAKNGERDCERRARLWRRKRTELLADGERRRFRTTRQETRPAGLAESN